MQGHSRSLEQLLLSGIDSSSLRTLLWTMNRIFFFPLLCFAADFGGGGEFCLQGTSKLCSSLFCSGALVQICRCLAMLRSDNSGAGAYDSLNFHTNYSVHLCLCHLFFRCFIYLLICEILATYTGKILNQMQLGLLFSICLIFHIVTNMHDGGFKFYSLIFRRYLKRGPQQQLCFVFVRSFMCNWSTLLRPGRALRALHEDNVCLYTWQHDECHTDINQVCFVPLKHIGINRRRLKPLCGHLFSTTCH